jgi:photosystem II stability/assembly factor-like uncharacterized protein
MRLRKFCLLFAAGILLLFPLLAFGRSYWRKVNVNHPGQIEAVAMSPSGQHIVLSGDFSLHSSDRGVTWDTVNGCAYIMDFGDETHLFGAGSNPQSGFVGVCRSTDYGNTWTLTELPQDLIQFNELDFIDSVHGWAVGNKDFIVTTNDGWQTWTTRPYGLPDDSGRYSGGG